MTRAYPVELRGCWRRSSNVSEATIRAASRFMSARANRCSAASRCRGWRCGRAATRSPSRRPRARGSSASTGSSSSTSASATPARWPATRRAPVLEVLRAPRGITTMLPTEDAAWVGEELTRRFSLPRWLFTLTATDANRSALRLARMLTGRPKVLVYLLLLPRLGRRVRGRRPQRRDRRARGQRRAARGRRGHHAGDRVQRPRSAGGGAARPATSPACWPSPR